jgi:hypothetical protein
MSECTWRIVGVIATLLFTSGAGADEISTRIELQSTVQKLFYTQDFAGLERMAEEFRRNKTRTPSGTWKLTFFYGALPDSTMLRLRDEAYVRSIHSIMTKWAETYPTSPTPRIFRAAVLRAHGWMYRGEGTARSVPRDMWALFEAKIAEASEYLQRYKDIASVDPHWYVEMVIIATAQGWPLDKFLSLIQEGTAREPYYYQLYFSAANYLLPQWHGDNSKLEAFARAAVAKTKEQDGMGMYARVYWSASGSFQGNIFRESNLDWTTMKTGMRDLLRRYPDAWNLVNFISFACQAEDRTEARRLLATLKSHDITMGEPTDGFSACVAWATSP